MNLDFPVGSIHDCIAMTVSDIGKYVKKCFASCLGILVV